MHPILFEIGNFTIYTYGFTIALAILVSINFILRRCDKIGLSPADVMDCLLAVIGGGLVGGRLLFVILNFSYFQENPIKIFLLSEGGLAVHGAILVGVLSGAVLCKLKNISFWTLSDISAPYAALAQGIGRIGCFFNGCCYGRSADGFSAIMFPGSDIARVPTQIYYSVALICVFATLLVLSKKEHFKGFVFTLYLILYSLIRIIIDSFRADNMRILFGMTLPQIISIFLLLGSISLYLFMQTRAKKEKLL